MSIQTKTNLKALFEDGDVPTGANFADLIDSSVNLAETSLQTMNGALYAPEITTARVSAQVVVITGTLNANVITPTTVDAITVNAASVSAGTGSFVNVSTGSLAFATMAGTSVSAGNGYFNNASIGGLSAMAVSAANANIISLVSPSAALTNLTSSTVSAATATVGRLQSQVFTVSGIGSAQGGAALVPTGYATLFTSSGAQAFILPGGYPGARQWMRNASSVSARIYPPSGGSINGAGANVGYDLPSGGRLMVVHEASAAFATWRSTQ